VKTSALLLAGLVAAVALPAGCAPPPAEPAEAVIRESAPPWEAPRDAISYIRLAGLEELRSGYVANAKAVADLNVEIDGQAVEIPAFIGIDRVRSVEAPLHTHDSGGVVWVEHPDTLPATTLGQFFDLWGVRFDRECLGDACGSVDVTVNGEPLDPNVDPRSVRWVNGLDVAIDARR
jgi:hypothetical protein